MNVTIALFQDPTSLTSSYLFLLYYLLLQRPVPLAEMKAPQPKFDLAATNFPPLPGCSVSPQGEPVLENRMSDVVRGLNRDKVCVGTDKPIKACSPFLNCETPL